MVDNSLQSLDFYFDQVSKNYILPKQYKDSEKDNLLIEKLYQLQKLMQRDVKKVTIFGVFKAGKSTFLNALIGTEILPSRTNRATGVITRINHDSNVSAFLTRGDNKQSVDYKDIAKYILLDVSQNETKLASDVNTVEITLPFPLLKDNCCLVDTPGLLDNQSLTDKTYKELEESDLAVIVLRADKILSQPERESIERINTLLNGNIIYVINRLGLIEPEDEKDVLNWVQKTLQNTGNRFVGAPKIFATDALSVLQSSQETQYLAGLNKFKEWLEYLLHSPVSDRVVMLSRLGILTNYIDEANLYFQAKLEELAINIVSLEQAAQKNWEERLDEFNQRMLTLKVKITESKNELVKKIEKEVKNILSLAQDILNEDDPNWAERVQDKWLITCKICSNIVFTQITNDLKNTISYIPPLDFSKSIQISELNLSIDNASKITQVIGGSWILGTTRFLSESILGNNLKESNLNEINNCVKRAHQELLKELDLYFDKIETELNTYIETSAPKLETPTQLTEARKAKITYLKLVDSVTTFQKAIAEIKESIFNWQLEFRVIWQKFSQEITSIFERQYKQNKKQIKSEEDIYELIQNVIHAELVRWDNRGEFYLIWLEVLQEHSVDIAKRFQIELKRLQLQEFLEFSPNFKPAEISLFIFAFLSALAAWYWGQNIGLLLGVAIIVFVFYSVKNSRAKRIRKQTEIIFRKFDNMLNKQGKKLEKILLDLSV